MKILYKNSQICVFQSALFQTNATVINTADCIIVVDPNWLPHEIDEIKKHVVKCGQKPVYLLFTHSDYDHIIGYGAFPEAVGVIASRAFVENPDKEKNLEQIRTFDDDYYIVRDYKIEYPTVTHIVEYDNQILEIGDTQIRFFLALGHNPDGIFTIINDIWIAGDYLCSVEFPYIYHSSIEYEKTIQKTEKILSEHKIMVMVCGHGDIVSPKNTKTNVETEILKRKKEMMNYIRLVRASINNPGKPFIFEEYIQRYNFPRIMKRFHDKNIELMRNENV